MQTHAVCRVQARTVCTLVRRASSLLVALEEQTDVSVGLAKGLVESLMDESETNQKSWRMR